MQHERPARDLARSPPANDRFADERPELNILEQLRHEQPGKSLAMRMPTAEDAEKARERARQEARAEGADQHQL